MTVPSLHLKEADEVGRALMKASRMLQEAQHLAHHDALTGLANHLLFTMTRTVMQPVISYCAQSQRGSRAEFGPPMSPPGWVVTSSRSSLYLPARKGLQKWLANWPIVFRFLTQSINRRSKSQPALELRHTRIREPIARNFCAAQTRRCTKPSRIANGRTRL